MVPVPMARRLVLMPVLPRATVSAAENFAGSGWDARAARRFFEVSFFAVNHVAPRAVVERTRNSRRCIETSGASFGLWPPASLGYISQTDGVCGFFRVHPRKILTTEDTEYHG